MTITETEAAEAMLTHHRSLLENVGVRVEGLSRAVAVGGSYEAAAADLVAYLADEVLPHALAEEHTIYPTVARRAELAGTVAEMVAEHRTLATEVERLADAATGSEAATQGKEIGTLFTGHVARENDILLPALLADDGVDLPHLLVQMHRLTEAAQQTPLVEDAAAPDHEVVMLTRFLEAATELAHAGHGDRACRLVASVWATLRVPRPELAVRVTAALHRLVRLVTEEPVAFVSASDATSDAASEPTRGHSVDFELDVRSLAPAQRHQSIFATYHALNPGAGFVLVNDHDPKPLRYQFEAEHADEFKWDSIEAGPQVWRVRIGKVPSSPRPGVVRGSGAGTEVELDVRVLPHGGRHESIFATYDALAPGTGFVLVNDHDPKPLRYQFEEQHGDRYTWDYVEAGPEVWRVRIAKVEPPGPTMTVVPSEVRELAGQQYRYGFSTDLDTDVVPRGLSEEVITMISAKKHEPDWLLQWRLQAYRHWMTMEEPGWQNVDYGPLDYQDIIYYAAPKPKASLSSLDEVDPEVREMFDKLGISLAEQERLSGVAVDAIVDSVSVATTASKRLAEVGVIFCSFSDAVQNHPDLVRAYLGSVVPYKDNFFATLNSAVFTDGSFCYIPKGVKCPMELSTYFRINTADTGQFERTLIVAEDQATVSYLEGCTAPMRDNHQLHAAVVELVAMEGAEIKYSTVQNWYPGDPDGKGGVYNFVTKRGKCAGSNSKISWTQVETGSAITWKYPGVVLQGDNSVGEFYSVALSANHQQADTGTKMIHIGKNTRSTIVSKAISTGHGQNTYRGLVKVLRSAEGARNHTRCDSLLIGRDCGAHTFPYIEVKNPTAQIEHEATTSKVSEDQLFYCRQRGIAEEDATAMIVNGFCREVFKELPMEFAVEAQRLLDVSLEGSVG